MVTIKVLQLLLAFLIIQINTSAAKQKCSEIDKVEECSETEYESYVECMRKRMKRSLDCDMDDECDGSSCNQSNDCGECDCNYCSYNSCESNCQSCCVNAPVPCETRSCCQSTCHSQCRSSSCRRNCRSTCHSKIPTITSGGSSSSGSSNANSGATVKADSVANHNITTVINLHNMINNTNIIDTPIHINNTNYNNLTLIPTFTNPEHPVQQIVPPQNPFQPHVNPPYIPPVNLPPVNMPPANLPPIQQQTPDCCKIIGPRQCVPIQAPPFQKCFHYRKAHCGEICKTSIMHAEHHEVCDQVNPPTCHEQIAYIPQPQPRCSYTSTWPYVRCGIEKPNCNGCYGHVVSGGAPTTNCPSSCYDDGYDVGPMYRQGPSYRQNYMPAPPCEVMGNCGGGYAGYGGGYVNGYGSGQSGQYNMNPYEDLFQIEFLNNTVAYGANNINPSLYHNQNNMPSKDYMEDALKSYDTQIITDHKRDVSENDKEV